MLASTWPAEMGQRSNQSSAWLDGQQASHHPSQNKHNPKENHPQVSLIHPTQFYPLKQLQKNMLWRYLQPKETHGG